MLEQNLKEHLACFHDLAKLGRPIEAVAQQLTECLRQGRKILICGNGGSAADAQHFAAEMVGRFHLDRAALPAIALTTDTSIITAVGNDNGFKHLFSRQVQALGRPDDVLIALSTSGASDNIIEAVKTARNQQLTTVALTGNRDGALSSLADAILKIPSPNTPRIQEAHIFILHFWAERIEAALFGKKDNT